MAQILQPYEQYLPSTELSTDQTLSDIFFALDKLKEIFTSVNDRISKRIEEENVKIQQINDRIATCTGKVNSVRGSTKATTVHSTAKFPADKNLPAPLTLFSAGNKVSTDFTLFAIAESFVQFKIIIIHVSNRSVVLILSQTTLCCTAKQNQSIPLY